MENDKDTYRQSSSARSARSADSRARSADSRRASSSSRSSAASRSSSGARRSGNARSAGSRNAGTRQASSSARSKAPSRNEIIRNRIIAVVVLVLLVVLLVSLVSCVVRVVTGSGEQDASASAAAAATSTSASAQSASAAATDSSNTASAQASAGADVGEGVESPWTASGRFSSGDAELDQIIKSFCDGNTNKDLSREDNAFNVYCQAVWSDYIERDDNQEPVGTDWDIVYAKQFYNEGGGNCYEMAAFVEYLLKYFGYEDAQGEPCHVLRQSGTYGEHGLVFVTDTDGRAAMCDSSFGANGWMLDADSYTMKIVDVGQDPSEFKIADFEEVVTAYWL